MPNILIWILIYFYSCSICTAFIAPHYTIIRSIEKGPSFQLCRNRYIASKQTSNYDDRDIEQIIGNTATGKKVIVVGGGVGGLAVAARIKSKNPQCNVQVYEKNESPGGRCGSFNVTQHPMGTFRHERGPSLLLLPHLYEQLFTDVTANTCTASDFGLRMLPCQPAYQVVFEDGDRIDVGFPKQQRQLLYTNTTTTTNSQMDELEELSREKMNRWEANGAQHWDDYLRACSAFLDCGLPNFIEQRFDLPSFPSFIFEALRDYGRAWPLKPHSDVLDAIFESNKLKALASFQDLYVGLEPHRNNDLLVGGVLQSTAPAVFGLLAAIELHPTNKICGVYAPEGGFRKVTDSFVQLAESLNVTIQCSTTVTKVTEAGVYVIDEKTGTSCLNPADLVIVNADLPYAKASLIDKSPGNAKDSIHLPVKYDWDAKYLFSSGVVAFHWSVSKSLRQLNTHNVFMCAGNSSDDSGTCVDSWKVLRRSSGQLNQPYASVDEPFNFYVHRATKTDRTAAPEGMDAIMVLVPCKPLKHDPACSELSKSDAIEKYKMQFDKNYTDSVRDAVLHRLSAIPSLAQLKNHIIHEVLDTPAASADAWNVGAGTPFGLSHGFAQLSVARPGPDSSGLKNTLFCGASTRPGNGVPLVLVGAKLVADQASERIAAFK